MCVSAISTLAGRRRDRVGGGFDLYDRLSGTPHSTSPQHVPTAHLHSTSPQQIPHTSIRFLLLVKYTPPSFLPPSVAVPPSVPSSLPVTPSVRPSLTPFLTPPFLISPSVSPSISPSVPSSQPPSLLSHLTSTHPYSLSQVIMSYTMLNVGMAVLLDQFVDASREYRENVRCETLVIEYGDSLRCVCI